MTAAVLAEKRAEWGAPASRGFIRTLRALARAQAEAWRVADDQAEAAQVVVSELLTNALRYGAARKLTLRLMLNGGELTIAVDDENPAHLPVLATHPAPGDAEGGNGLILVDALAERWGATTGPDTKTVYAVLAVTPDATEPTRPANRNRDEGEPAMSRKDRQEQGEVSQQLNNSAATIENAADPQAALRALGLTGDDAVPAGKEQDFAKALRAAANG